ncbi:MAG: DUF4345 domain-containing protein [Gammaproteobacteria bacterium]|jgi:hypothetical protein|nr:DUF4345 domain-containing protein [Gammaproteobacteria bacterium]|tara:strand:+ start:398 stop:796 length:399 start_codon:yes stop_codon:yes gene_type:complete
MKIINNNLIDKALLVLFAFEYLLFGLWGLVDPIAISNMIGLTFNDITAFSEFRAQYTFFTALGVLSFIAVFKKEIQIRTYFILALLNGSFVIGRTLGIFLDGMPDQTLWSIFIVDLAVFLLCFWRYKTLNNH